MRVKRKDLEIFLAQLEKIPHPKLEYEQYASPPRVAANLLWLAAVENDDIYGKTVLDLGCGSGILGIGAAYLGARTVVGIDIDFESVMIAKKNSKEFEYNETCHWICIQAEECQLKGIDTVIMNPPFGMRKESISRDRAFLETAIGLSNSIYSIIPHAEKTRKFFKEFCSDLGAKIEMIYKMEFEINHLYQFHKKKQHLITVDLYQIKV